jgi:serine/threonine protein kinase
VNATNSPTRRARPQAGIILGTAVYGARAGARKRVDKRADIWAFACVLFEMIAGRAAFSAKSRRHHRGGPGRGGLSVAHSDACKHPSSARAVFGVIEAPLERHRRRAHRLEQPDMERPSPGATVWAAADPRADRVGRRRHAGGAGGALVAPMLRRCLWCEVTFVAFRDVPSDFA